MRPQINKRTSTKTERIFSEILKDLHIPFKHRVIIQGHEVDFLIDDFYVIEIDGHSQDECKNDLLVSSKYIVLHFANVDMRNRAKVKQIIKELNDNKIDSRQYSSAPG